MKCFIPIMIFSSFAFLLQDEKIIILENDTELNYDIGNGYTRIALSYDDIKVTDSLVIAYVKSHHKDYRWTSPIDNYPGYYRQYAAYKRGSPERIVFVNAFRNKGDFDGKYLKHHIVSAKGGGSSFFRIKVNLETLTCFDLSVNASK